jgi:hypothetical protein
VTSLLSSRRIEKSRAFLRLKLNESLEMHACRWHQRCLEKRREFGTSSGSSNNTLPQPCIDVKGVQMTAVGTERQKWMSARMSAES